MYEIVMPKLGEAMEEGVIGTWMKDPGDEVTEGEPIAEIETDKVEMSYESPISGRIVELLVPEGRPVPVGEPIARVETP